MIGQKSGQPSYFYDSFKKFSRLVTRRVSVCSLEERNRESNDAKQGVPDPDLIARGETLRSIGRDLLGLAGSPNDPGAVVRTTIAE